MTMGTDYKETLINSRSRHSGPDPESIFAGQDKTPSRTCSGMDSRLSRDDGINQHFHKDELKAFGAGIDRLIQGESLCEEECYAMFKAVLLDEQPDLQQGAFLAALAAKGETVDELVGAWRAIDELDTVHADNPSAQPLFENSGTGMDSLKTFNVSSAAAIVAAAGGVAMARHGSRAITSACGTVDIMEAVGIGVDCTVEDVSASIRTAGIGLFNGASAHVHPQGLARILSQIRFGSTLNIAASLAHPCSPSLGLRGVYSPAIMDNTAQMMQRLGYERGMVVFGRDADSGLTIDELSVSGATEVLEFGPGGCSRYTLQPEDLGLRRAHTADVSSSKRLDVERGRFLDLLAGRGAAACADFVCLNSAAILYIAGRCSNLEAGLQQSRELIGSGQALEKLQEWREAQPGNARPVR